LPNTPGYVNKAVAEVAKASAHLSAVLGEARGQANVGMEIVVTLNPNDPVASGIIEEEARRICRVLAAPEELLKAKVIQ
jgi:hypothetical protein